MDTKALDAAVTKNAEPFGQLLRCEAVFGVAGVAHNGIADCKVAGVVTAADDFRQPR